MTVGARIRYSIVQFWRAPIARPPGSDEDHKLLRALSRPTRPSSSTRRFAARARTVVRQLAADPAHPIDRIVEGDDVRASGGFPGAAMVVGLAPGFRTGSALSGTLVTSVTSPGGTHGFLPGTPDMDASFFVVGEGVPPGKNLGAIDMRDIAVTLAARLGVALPQAKGRNLL